MQLILTISFRNLLRHKRKSFVIGTILFTGAMIMTFGNGVITGRDIKFKENFIDRFIGDITIMSNSQEDENIFPIFQVPKPNKVIEDYPGVKNVLQKQNYIEKFLPITIGTPMILGKGNNPIFFGLIGADLNEYREMFDDDIVLIEGEFPGEGERGLLLNSTLRKLLYDMQNIWVIPEGGSVEENNFPPESKPNMNTLKIRNDIVVMPISDDDVGLDVRLPVKGIFKFRYLNEMRWQNIVDIESFRESYGYVTASDSQIIISKDNENLLNISENNLDDLFSPDSVVKRSKNKETFEDLKNIPMDVPTGTKPVDVNQGAYNFITVKLKKNAGLEESIETLNTDFQKAGIDCRAVSWKHTSGIILLFSMFPRALFGVFVNFIFLVAIIMIVNTLSMAAAERADEIGMMRAIGAKKDFIGKMFFAETLLLSFIFGGAGIIAGVIIVLILSSANITTANEMMQLAYAGETFQPLIDGNTLIRGILQLAVVTLSAMVYPIVLARRITPLEAVNRE